MCTANTQPFMDKLRARYGAPTSGSSGSSAALSAGARKYAVFASPMFSGASGAAQTGTTMLTARRASLLGG